MAAFFSFHGYLYRGQGGPLGMSLEEAASRFDALEGLYFEWDGSLTWANQRQGWQIDGTVYDDPTEIQYFDVHGRAQTPQACPFLWQHLAQLFAVWQPIDQLRLMRLPNQSWQDLQSFENECVGE